MNLFSFQNPAALFLLPVVLAPLFIHLFQHHRAKIIKFPSIVFLKAAQTKTGRRHKLQNWLLLLVRTIIVLSIIFSMAQPSVNIQLPGWLAPREINVVLIIDDSASMAVKDGDSTILAKARTMAGDIISVISPNSRVAVIGGSSEKRVLCGLTDPFTAQKRIEALDQTEFGTDLIGAILKADKILAVSGQREQSIIILSDLQQNAFNNGNTALPMLESMARIDIIEVGENGAAKNLSWQKIDVIPLQKKLVIEGVASNGLDPTIRLIQKDRIVCQTQARPDSQGKFSLSVGWNGGEGGFLETSHDDLPIDNRFYLANNLACKIKILIIAEAEPAEVLFRAFNSLASAGFKIGRKSDPAREDINRADLLVVASPRISEISEEILSAVKGGKGALIIPPEKAQIADYNDLLSKLDPAIRISGFNLQNALSQSYNLSLGSQRYFRDIGFRDFDKIAVYRHWILDSEPPWILKIGQSTLGLSSIECGLGKAVVWSFGVEPNMTDISYHPVFLVMLNQICEGLSGRSNPGYVTGQVYRSFANGTTELISPKGNKLSGEYGASGTGEWLLSETGWYRVKNGVFETSLAVNIPYSESVLVKINDTELKKIIGKNQWGRSFSAKKIHPGPGQLKGFLMVIIGLLLVLELMLRGRLEIFLKNHLTTR